MTPLLLALGASLAWGVADFVGPLVGRTLGTLRVLLWAQVGGVVAIAIAVAIRGEGPAGWGVLFAIAAAVGGTAGLYAYYRGMQLGAMSVVAPIAGVSAIIPVVFGIATGDSPSVAQIAGIALRARRRRAGVGRASGRLAARRRGRRARAPGSARLRLLLPVDACRGQGRLLVGVAGLPRDRAARSSPRPLRPEGRELRLGRRDLAIVVGVGIGDTLGNVLFAASSGHGLVSLTAVLASLYPIVTVLLAAAVLRERVAPCRRPASR